MKNKHSLTHQELEAWANDELDDVIEKEDMYFHNIIDDDIELTEEELLDLYNFDDIDSDTDSDEEQEGENYPSQYQRHVSMKVSDQTFIVGQRWMSQSEPNLGLGLLMRVDRHTLTIHFKASDTTRVYNYNNAPLIRVIFQPGDIISALDCKNYTVQTAMKRMDLYYYETYDDTGEKHTIAEDELSDFHQLDLPKLRVLTNHFDKWKYFSLRYQTYAILSESQRSQVSGMIGPKIALLPHQLYISNEVSKRYAPRVMLADEVGLGKTIEAGLIIYRSLMLGVSQRILLLIPSHLCSQWLIEMRKRFNLYFQAI